MRGAGGNLSRQARWARSSRSERWSGPRTARMGQLLEQRQGRFLVSSSAKLDELGQRLAVLGSICVGLAVDDVVEGGHAHDDARQRVVVTSPDEIVVGSATSTVGRSWSTSSGPASVIQVVLPSARSVAASMTIGSWRASSSGIPATRRRALESRRAAASRSSFSAVVEGTRSRSIVWRVAPRTVGSEPAVVHALDLMALERLGDPLRIEDRVVSRHARGRFVR